LAIHHSGLITNIKHSPPQEKALAVREKREKEKKQRLDTETEKDLTQQTTATQYQHTKNL
jgi:hypothetical protein